MSTTKEQMQYLFDTSVRGVINQGTKAHEPGNSQSCMYRTEDNLKCAVGQLISDSCYDIYDIEGFGIGDDPAVSQAVSKSVGFELDNETISLLLNIQDAHDNLPLTNFIEEFKDKTSVIAKEFNLEWKF